MHWRRLSSDRNLRVVTESGAALGRSSAAIPAGYNGHPVTALASGSLRAGLVFVPPGAAACGGIWSEFDLRTRNGASGQRE